MEIMTTQHPLPEREVFEREIHDLFENGDLSSIARYLHKDQGQVSKAYNPYDETRHNPVFEFLRHLWAMDCRRDALADVVLSIVNREREKWLTDGVEVIDAPAKLTGRCLRETGEAVECELAHADLDTQIHEFQEARDAYDAKIKALIAMRMPTRQAAATAAFAKFNGNGRHK